MDVLGTPILTFSALSLIIIMLGVSLFMLRARMILLESKLLNFDENTQGRLSQLHDVIGLSFEKSENIGRSSLDDLLKVLTETIHVSNEDIKSGIEESQRALTSSVTNVLDVSEQKVTSQLSSVINNLETTTEQVKANAAYTKAIVERTAQKVLEGISDSGKGLLDQLQAASESVATEQKNALIELNKVRSDVISKIESSGIEQRNEVISCLNEASSATNDFVEESTNALLSTIELVRVSNVITENRNLYNEGRLVLETESFVKKFDRCELTEIEDKVTGQVTKNEYQDGELRKSKTYRTDSLEYIGYYEGGILKTMEDLTGPEGTSVTQYEYDEAGEVESII